MPTYFVLGQSPAPTQFLAQPGFSAPAGSLVGLASNSCRES